MGLEIKGALAFGGIVSLNAITPAIAQSKYDIQGAGDIVVTARRMEERLQDVPISITVVNQETLAQRNITSTTDLATYTPSLSTNTRFGPERASFTIRGFTQELSTAPSVGVYFADVVAPRSVGPISAGDGSGPGKMFDLQSVQVLKGPQGTLFGRNTTGGAILLVPRKPTDRLEGYIEGSFGNFAMRRVEAVLNAPLSDTFRVRGGIDWHKRDGYLHNRSGIGPKDLLDVNYVAARLSLVGDLTPDLENYLIAGYSRSDTNGSGLRAFFCNRAEASNPFNPIAGAACAQLDRAALRGDGFWDIDNSASDAHAYTRQWQVINTTTWTISQSLTIKNLVSYTENVEQTASSLFGDNLFLGSTVRLPSITLHPGPYGPLASQSTFTEEVQLQGRALAGRLKWQAGAYLELSNPLGLKGQDAQIFVSCTDGVANQCNSGPFGIGTIARVATKDWFNSKGFYAQGTYALSNSLSATGGIRYTIDKQRNVSRNLTVSFPMPNAPVFTCQNVLSFNSDPVTYAPLVVGDADQCRQQFRTKSQKPTWTIDLEYKPVTDMMLYGKWSRGYRAGGINSNNLGRETWGPEKVDSYELGLKNTFRGAVQGNFSIAAYYNDFTDQQLSGNIIAQPAFANVVPQAQLILNAGKSRIMGVEVEGSLSPIEGFGIDFGYAYLDTKLKSIEFFPATVIYQAPVPNAVAANECAARAPTMKECGTLALSPKNKVTLAASYVLPLRQELGKITFGATYVHTDASNSVSILTSPFLYRNPATDLLNLNVNWKSAFGSPIDLAFFMTNVTNEKAWTYANGGYAFLGLDAATLAPPRMWGFRLRYSFGD